MNSLSSATSTSVRDVREAQLVEAIAEYQQAMDQGSPLERNEFLGRYPEIANELTECLDNLDFLRNIAPRLESNRLGERQECEDDSESAALTPEELKLGDFRVIREIGRGGMGVVYEAQQLSMSRRVALKVLPFAAILDPKVIQRFRSEAQIAGQLVHQHIVPVYSVGCERGIHFYAMQYIEGRTLAEVIQELKEFRPEQASSRNIRTASGDTARAVRTKAQDGLAVDHEIDKSAGRKSRTALITQARSHQEPAYIQVATELALQAALALDFAHGQGVIHRDIKPSNVMVDSGGKAWVTDFGLAHVESGPSVTITGDFLGTLRYMSPEQTLAQRVVVDHRTDIYSLGLTFYELLTMRPAFTAAHRQELLRQISFEEPPRPKNLNRNIPADLETIILKAIEKNPADRYGSARDLANDLKRFIEDRPIQARRPTRLQRLGKWCRRHRSLVTACLVSLFFLLVVVASSATVVAIRLGEVARHEQAIAQEEIAAKRRMATMLASSYHDKGQMICQNGEIAGGMLWMTRALRVAPLDSASLREAILQNIGAWSRHTHHLDAVLRHDEPVTTVAFCPAGSRVFTGHRNGAAVFWDPVRLQRVGEPKELGSAVSTSSYCPASARLAAGTAQGVVALFDTETLTETARLNTQSHVQSLAFDQDGDRLIVGGKSQLIVHSIDDNQSQPFEIPLNHQVAAVSFSEQDQPLVLLETKSTYRLKNLVEDRDLGPTVQKTDLGRTREEISKDGQWFAAGGGANLLSLWRAQTGKTILYELPHGGDIHAVAISPQGRFVATAGYDSAALIRDATTGERIGPLLDHTGYILAPTLDFAPDGRSILVGAEDGSTRLWSLAVDPSVGSSTQLDKPVAAIATTRYGDATFVNEQTLFVSSADRVGQLWRIAPGADSQLVRTLREGLGWLEASRDGELIAAGSSNHVVHVWDAASGDERIRIECSDRLRDVAISPDKNRILTTHRVDRFNDTRGYAQVWDVATGQRVGPKLHHESTVSCGEFSPNGQYIVTGSYDRTAQLWDARKLTRLGMPFVHTQHVEYVDVSPDSRRIAVATSGRTAHLWDVASRLPVGHPLQHRSTVQTIEFCPAPQRPIVLTGSIDGTAQLWHADSGKPLGPPLKHRQEVWTACFAPNGSRVLLAGGGRLCLLTVPQPVDGVLERVDLWVELITGKTLNLDAGGVVELIDPTAWMLRQQRLEQLGGPLRPSSR